MPFIDRQKVQVAATCTGCKASPACQCHVYRCREILYTNHCPLNDVLERLHDQLHLPAASHATSRWRRMDRLPDFGSSLGEKVSVMFVMEKILGAASSFALLVSADSEAG